MTQKELLDAPIVEVHWVDSESIGHAHRWIQTDDVDEFLGDTPLSITRTVGILYRETEDYLVIVASAGRTEVDAPMRIPHSQIMGWWKIEFGQGATK